MWRRSGYSFERCSSVAGSPAVALYRTFTDGACLEPFVNWTLSVKAMDYLLVPPGPNVSAARGPPIWHSVVSIHCVNCHDAPAYVVTPLLHGVRFSNRPSTAQGRGAAVQEEYINITQFALDRSYTTLDYG